jgi:hypothetical protein
VKKVSIIPRLFMEVPTWAFIGAAPAFFSTTDVEICSRAVRRLAESVFSIVTMRIVRRALKERARTLLGTTHIVILV